MTDKIKRQQSPQWLSFAERALYWGSCLIMMVTLFAAINTVGLYWTIDNGMGLLERIGFCILSGILVALLGAAPAGLLFVISRLLRWGLRLQGANNAKDEMLHALREEKSDLETTIRLMDHRLDTSDHISLDEVLYEASKPTR